MTRNPIFGVAVTGTGMHELTEMRALSARANLRAALGQRRPMGSRSPHQEGRTVAKNKNQNRKREQQHEQRSGESTSMEPQDTAKSAIADDRMMPATTHVTRKQNKRFGHN
jgi:hypothetical protein